MQAHERDHHAAGLVTAKEAAELAGVTYSAVRMAIHRHKLDWAAQGTRVGLLERRAVEAWKLTIRKRRLPSVEEYLAATRGSELATA